MNNKTYISIDLKSFYASVECQERGLDPLNTNLIVADPERTDKTICLAVTPSLKAFGIPGRARLFEVKQRISEVNALRRKKVSEFCGCSYYSSELRKNPALKLDYIIAPPQMARYMEVSTQIYSIYLKYASPEDIHIYSVDEVFIDATPYISGNGRYNTLSARKYASMLINAVLEETGITATAGIGSNLYLSKVAMDIVAKHIPADKNGVRIAELDENTYKRDLWSHTPLTDFWRVGKGYTEKLYKSGIYTMGDIARTSLSENGEQRLYKLFGVNAELLIDHAWGYEPCEISDIKAYRPASNSISTGQVLQCAYSNEKGRLIIREMADQLSLDLVEKGFVTEQIILNIGFDTDNSSYTGEKDTDRYGRAIPKPFHGSKRLSCRTSSSRLITEAALDIYGRIEDTSLTVRRISIAAANIVDVSYTDEVDEPVQLDFFGEAERNETTDAEEKKWLEREYAMQKSILSIKKKYGKNAVLRGTNFEEGATARQRNEQVGGHKA